MQRYNPRALFGLGTRIGALSYVCSASSGVRFGDIVTPAIVAIVSLDNLLEASALGLPPSVRSAAEALKRSLESLGAEGQPPFDSPDFVDVTLMQTLSREVKHFQTLFLGDLMDQHLYRIEEVLGSAPTILIEQGEKLLPTHLIPFLSASAAGDFRSAARCIAFDLPMAATFHIVRATEEVVRSFHVHLLGALPDKPSERTMGQLLQMWKGTKAEPRRAELDHIRNVYRNPVVHPEIDISIEQSHEIFQDCISAIRHLLSDMKCQPDTTDAHTSPPLPLPTPPSMAT